MWDTYRVILTNRQDPVFVCARSFVSAINKVNILIDQWDDKDNYSIVSISYVSPCLI